MDQDLLIRLFRSIKGDADDDIVKIAKKIIEVERQRGHEKLASRLKETLSENVSNYLNLKKELSTLLPKGTVIPTDKRHNSPLADLVETENLRHQMILSDEIESHMQRIEKEYIARERLAHHGLKPRKKILFYGAPGCGKSMAAERIAWNIGLPFLKVRFEAITSSFLGESASNLKILFDAIKASPCVLLLDEFDFIAKTRSSNQDVGEMHRIVNILLSLLEDYNAPGLLIATTNLEGSLDKALFRRFDDIIEIPKPGIDEITRLLRHTLASMSVSKDIRWDDIARKMEGFSAALVVKVANDAAKSSILQGSKTVDRIHIKKSLEESSAYNR